MTETDTLTRERAQVRTIGRVGVVGCGIMGSGIAEISAVAGSDVVVLVRSGDSAAAGRERIARSLRRAVDKGRMTGEDRDAALDRVCFAQDPAALADREFVVETIAEDLPAKLELLGKLDAVVEDEDAVLASNTSSLSVGQLALAARRPERVLGVHFFNPVPLLPLVELVCSELTSVRTALRAEEFVRDVLGKTVVRAPDRAGFIVNALLFPYLMSAVRMLEAGLADAGSIDAGMRLGCNHPLGPLALIDLIGLDTTLSIVRAIHAETGEPLHCAPKLLESMVADGLLGKKAGRGFHCYG